MKNIIISNNISVKGKEVDGSSKTLKGFTPIYTATIINKLNEKKYNIEIEKLNNEFGLENGYNKNILNKINENNENIAVIAETGLNMLNEKEGEIIGFKPSYGRVSRYGLFGFVSSMDNISIYSKNIEDIIQILEDISGKDMMDLTCKEENFIFKKSEVKSKDLDLDSFSEDKVLNLSKTVLDIITYGEASTNLAAIDGIRYGLREKGNSYEEIIINSRSNFEYEAKKVNLLGSFVLNKENLEDTYFRAMKLRRLISEKMNNMINDDEVLVLNCSNLNESDDKNIKLNFASAVVLSGMPALKMKLNEDEVIICAKPFCENTLFNFAKTLNKEALNV